MSTNIVISTSQDANWDNENKIDEVSWKYVIKNALTSSHGLFGEASDYLFLYQNDKIAYIKVNYTQRIEFSSAISSYISSGELMGVPLVVNIIQETPRLQDLKFEDDEKAQVKDIIYSILEDDKYI